MGLEEIKINRLHLRPRRRMETVSLRISSDLRSTLEEEATKTGVSFTALVSEVLGRYVSWGRYAEKLKFVPSSKDFLRELFQTVPKEAIPSVAKKLGETSADEELVFLFRHKNIDNVVRFLDLWSSHYASEHHFDGKTHFYTLHHDVNLNYSRFLKEYVSSLIQSTAPIEVRFETMSPTAVAFSFETLNGKIPGTRENNANNRAVENSPFAHLFARRWSPHARSTRSIYPDIPSRP